MIRPLTSLRFLFAFMVFCCHCPFYTDPDTFAYKLSHHVMSEGYIGVSFFFILSGFILSLNYADSFEKEKVSAKEFWILRFARIYPLYLATLLIEIPFTFHEYLASAATWWGRFAACFFMVQSWVPDIRWAAAFNTPSWSISAEAFFYALFPLLIIRIRHLRPAVIVSLCFIVVLSVCMWFTPPQWQKALYYNNPLGRLGEFVLGIALYRFYEMRRAVWSFSYATRMELAAVLLFVLFFSLHSFIPKVFRFSIYYWPPMVFLLYVFARSAGALSKALSVPAFVLLGEASFAFYMIHYRVGGLLKIANSRFLHIDQANLLYFLLYFLTTLTGSIAVYFLFERSANRYLRRRLLPARQKPSVSPVQPTS
jgi:peptidoglycan/LPS O-acetylase OafA/YrhL